MSEIYDAIQAALREELSKHVGDIADAAKGEAPSGDGLTLHVKRTGYTVPVSTEIALDYGLITEEEARARGWTPPPPIPRLRRWRIRFEMWWYDHKPHAHIGPCDHSDCI